MSFSKKTFLQFLWTVNPKKIRIKTKKIKKIKKYKENRKGCLVSSEPTKIQPSQKAIKIKNYKNIEVKKKQIKLGFYGTQNHLSANKNSRSNSLATDDNVLQPILTKKIKNMLSFNRPKDRQNWADYLRHNSKTLTQPIRAICIISLYNFAIYKYFHDLKVISLYQTLTHQ